MRTYSVSSCIRNSHLKVTWLGVQRVVFVVQYILQADGILPSGWTSLILNIPDTKF